MGILRDETEYCVSLGDFLEKKVLRVPEYQRDYEWGKKNIDSFINSTLDGFNKNDSDRFFGVFVLQKYPNGTLDSSKDVYDVIDGQQRLTTLFLFLLCVAEKKIISWDKVCEYLYKSSYSGVSVFRLSYTTRNSTQEYLLNFVDAVQKFVKDGSVRKKNDLLEEGKRSSNKSIQNIAKNYEQLYDFVSNECAKYSVNLEEYVVYVLKKMCVTVMVTDNLNSAMDLFESLNTIGKKLEKADIAKARLLSFLTSNDDYHLWSKKFSVLKEYHEKKKRMFKQNNYLKLYLNLLCSSAGVGDFRVYNDELGSVDCLIKLYNDDVRILLNGLDSFFDVYKQVFDNENYLNNLCEVKYSKCGIEKAESTRVLGVRDISEVQKSDFSYKLLNRLWLLECLYPFQMILFPILYYYQKFYNELGVVDFEKFVCKYEAFCYFVLLSETDFKTSDILDLIKIISNADTSIEVYEKLDLLYKMYKPFSEQPPKGNLKEITKKYTLLRYEMLAVEEYSMDENEKYINRYILSDYLDNLGLYSLSSLMTKDDSSELNNIIPVGGYIIVQYSMADSEKKPKLVGESLINLLKDNYSKEDKVSFKYHKLSLKQLLTSSDSFSESDFASRTKSIFNKLFDDIQVYFM